MNDFNPDWTVKPWDTIEELMFDRRYHASMVRMQLQLTPEDWEALERGDLRISEALAIRLQLSFGLSADFWKNLDGNYVRGMEAKKNANLRKL